MAIFGYVRKSLTTDTPPRAGVAAVVRLHAKRGGAIGLVLLIIGLCYFDFIGHLLWNLVTTPAHGEEFSPCQINGRPVACQHFLSSNPDQMRVREEWLRLQIPRDPRDQRRDARPPDGH